MEYSHSNENGNINFKSENIGYFISQLSNEQLNDFQNWMQTKTELDTSVLRDDNNWKNNIKEDDFNIFNLIRFLVAVSCEGVC